MPIKRGSKPPSLILSHTRLHKRIQETVQTQRVACDLGTVVSRPQPVVMILIRLCPLLSRIPETRQLRRRGMKPGKRRTRIGTEIYQRVVQIYPDDIKK